MNDHKYDWQFAKVVDTINGPALLVSGSVIEVRSADPDIVDLLSRALRGTGEVAEIKLGNCQRANPPEDTAAMIGGQC